MAQAVLLPLCDDCNTPVTLSPAPTDTDELARWDGSLVTCENGHRQQLNRFTTWIAVLTA